MANAQFAIYVLYKIRYRTHTILSNEELLVTTEDRKMAQQTQLVQEQDMDLAERQ